MCNRIDNCISLKIRLRKKIVDQILELTQQLSDDDKLELSPDRYNTLGNIIRFNNYRFGVEGQKSEGHIKIVSNYAGACLLCATIRKARRQGLRLFRLTVRSSTPATKPPTKTPHGF